MELLAALPFLPCFAMAWSPAGVLVVEVAVALDVVGMVAVGTRLVVGVVAKTLQSRHCFDNVGGVQDPFDAVATGRRHFHFHWRRWRWRSLRWAGGCVAMFRARPTGYQQHRSVLAHRAALRFPGRANG